jgi:hypothetical protein
VVVVFALVFSISDIDLTVLQIGVIVYPLHIGVSGPREEE